MIAGSKSFLASLDQLYAMLEHIREYAKVARFDDATLQKIELACEEAIVNIIKHGYQGSPGSIAIQCIKIPNGIKIIFQDEGIPFDPTLYHPGVSRESSGFGVSVMFRIMDEIHYKREKDSNNLTFLKYNNITS